MNFSRKSCENCLISWKSTRNHRSGQNFITFRTNYHVFAFRWTFQKKVAKSASFHEKAREIIDLAKILQFFEQTAMSLHFDQLSGKKTRQVPHFVKKHEKSSIWPNLYNFSNKLPCLWISMNFSGKSCKKCLISLKSTKNDRSGQIFITFRTNYHVFAFRWTFQEKVTKSASFREKAREIIDFANTMQLFEQTTMFLHFDELLRKRLEKVVHFVKKHEKSWIWWKLETFRTNYHVFSFRWTFRQTVA